MNIFLVGGAGCLADALITKLNKNGHKVYVLTGYRERKGNYPRVFEQYHFPYNSESVQDIFQNVKPDVVLFLGAYDPHYNWEDARQESVSYISDLTNILNAFSSTGSGTFVYLSSQEVFGKSYPGDIEELEPVSPQKSRALAIAQGETMCRSFHETRKMDTLILRLDHLYGVPQRGEQMMDPCFQMTLKLLQSGKITGNSRVQFSLLYVDDAVEFLCGILEAEQRKQGLYHISSGEVISEMDLAEMIREAYGKEAELVDNTTGQGFRVILNSAGFDREFTRKIFVPVKEGVPRVVRYMVQNSSSYLRKTEDKGRGAWRTLVTIFQILIPYLENIICFIPFFMINNRAVGSEYFSKLDAYLLYVLLFAIIYGQQQAVFSALLATAGYCFRQMYTQSGLEVLMDYSTYIWMAQLFILGLVVGYMRDQIRQVREEEKQNSDYLSGRMNDIAEINDSNVRMKQLFEQQLVNQKDSLGTIYEITSELDQVEPEEVLFYAARTVSRLMDTDDVAIYTVANKNFARLFSFTSQTAKQMGNSICYPDLKEMYQDLKEHRVYINKTMNEKYPLMAEAIYSEDTMQTIIMLWGIPWERMNLAESNRLTVVGYLIQNAVVRATRYLDALRGQRYLEGTDILEKNAFQQIFHAFLHAEQNGVTEFSLLKIAADQDNFREIAGALEKTLRQTDYLGILDHQMYVLLANTSDENAGYVIQRMLDAGYPCSLVEKESVA